MRQLKIFTVLMVMLMSVAIQASAAGPRKAWSESENAFLLKTNDGLEQYTVDGTITFKAAADGSNIPTYRDCGVVFSPANEGEIIQITVNSIDLDGTTNYLLLYDGAIENIGYNYSYGADGQSKYLPNGFVKWYNNESAGETYTSTTADGKLSFGFHSGSANGQTGFNITVTSMSPKDMEYVSTGAITGLPNTYRGAKNQEIFGVDVVMDGGGNPLTLDELTIDASALSGSTQVTNVRLMSGNTVLATAATVGDALTATDVTLKGGHNRLMVVADITADATGSIPSLTIQSVKVAGEARTATATTGEAVAIDNMILMGSEPMTYTIGDDATFYDDGGKDGKITLNFNGQVTFVPATEGNAIKVDFNKLAIFNTSTIGKNDVFKFYSGREVNEANLITTLLTEPEIVKSTADDGSMTVTLNSTTGVAADGWEATVSQFLPGDMTVSGISGTAASTATVSAGETGAQMLVLDVQTDNTANPLSLTGINLTLADAKNVAKATAYYLGKKNTFATTDKIAEADVTGTAIALTGNKELIEGHNYIAVVLDLNDEAMNGEQITLSLQDVTVGGTAQTPAEAVSATRTVDNICRATKGSHSHLIKGDWKFMNTESSVYPGKYEFEDADYIVTFTPDVENAVAEINFESFDVYYASSDYGTKAVFEIYSGTEVNSANLLWNLKANSESKVGPGKVLRSTAADGSMTIRFNPKTTSSYYAGSGWSATVRPFLNHDMSVMDVYANQTSSDILAVGATDAQLIDFDIITEGTLTTKVLNGIKLNMSGTDAIDKVKVMYSGDDQTGANAVEFGTATEVSDNVVITGEKALAEGHNYFWVQVDVKQDADAEVSIDAAVTELQFADGNMAIENGNPDGNRVTKAMLIMQNGVNTVTVTKPLMFYDDGGPDGNFSKGFDGTVTFVPGLESYGIEINAIEFGIGSSTYNKFNVYNGREVDAANLVTTNGTSSPYYATTGPDHLISRAADGTMTIKFTTSTSSYATPLSGWAIEVKLHEYEPLAIDSIKAGAATTDKVVRGSQDAPINRTALVVSHDNNKVSVNDVKYTLTGTDNIATAKLYYSENVDGFNTTNLFATAEAADEVTFTAQNPIEITENGTYYLWLAYDLKDDAVPGEKVGATFVSLTGGVDTTIVETQLAEREIKAGFHGTYTIGSSADADYATFAAAVAAMAEGVDGPVRFEVEDGTYAENIKIENIAGTSEAHNVTFVSKNGNRNNVIVKGSGVIEDMPTSSYYKRGMVFVSNTPYVAFEDMSFIPQSQSYTRAVHIYNRSHHFALRNCYVKADLVTSGYSGMNLVQSEAISEDYSGNDHSTFENNQLEGGYIGFYLTGPSNVSHHRQDGVTVKNNVVNNSRSKGIYVMDTRNVVIEGNTVTNDFTTATNYSGMDLYRMRGASVVSGNVVANTQNTYSNGIYLRQECQGDDEDNPILIYNNSIAISNSPTNSTAGLQLSSDSKNIHVYYNTVSVSGTSGYALYNGGNSAFWSNIKLQNNLFQNLTTSGLSVALFNSEDNVKKVQMLNNVFYNAASDVMVKDYAADINALNTLVGSETNIVEKAEFLSETDLRLRAEGNLRMALPVSFITTDLAGVERDADAPTVGAYEYQELDFSAPVLAEGYPTVTTLTHNAATVATKWDKGGKLYSKVVKVTQPEGDVNAAPAKALTADELMNETPVDIMAETEAATAFNDLDEQTEYEASFLNVSALGTASEVATVRFTTARYIAPLELTLARVSATIDAGDETTLTPTVAGGDQPYTYEWRDQMNQVVSTDADAKVKPQYTYGYKLTVTSADGQTATAKTGVIVRGEQVIATMDDNYLAENTHDEAFDLDTDVYYSGSYAFNQGSMPSYSYWYGYCLSNETATDFATYGKDDWRNVVGAAHSGANYTVAYPEGLTVEVTNNAEGDSVMGVYVTNTPVAYKSMTVGDGFSDPFKAGSYFTLTVTGTAADGSSKSVDFNLADYRAAEANRYVLNTWEWIDLRSLGKVTKLMFTFSGSETNQWGLVTPKYFAMDDLGCMPDITEQTAQILVNDSTTIDLANYFEHADNGARERYYIDEEVDNEVLTAGMTDDTGTLNVSGNSVGEHTMLVHMTAKGHTQWVSLTINVVDKSTGIANLNGDREVLSVQYVNAMGQVSNRPFEGVNVIVTRYTDGTVTTVKRNM